MRSHFYIPPLVRLSGPKHTSNSAEHSSLLVLPQEMGVWKKTVRFFSLFERVLILIMGFLGRTFLWFVSVSSSSNPLVSILVAVHVLILLYFPALFFRLVLSPVLILTGSLLSGILRLGAIQRELKEIPPENIPANDLNSGECESFVGFLNQKEESGDGFEADKITEKTKHSDFLEELAARKEIEINSGRQVLFSDVFFDWNRRAPLEVIYEEYEGQEEEEDKGKNSPEISAPAMEKRDFGFLNILPLSLYYPESDSGSSSDGDFSVDFPSIEEWDGPENLCYRWEEDKDVIEGDNMIEISLLHKTPAGFPADEENLIEIDLSDQKIVKSPKILEKIPATISFTCLD